jgi:hypothetical protein
MKIQIWCGLPALLVLASCAASTGDYSASNAAAPTVAPPQRVDAVSDALGAKMNTMVAARPATN